MENKKETIEKCDYIHAHDDIIERVSSVMPDEEILYVLSESEMCVCDLANILGMTQSAISHQLRALKQSKLVRCRRDGKSVFYALSDSHVKTILKQGLEHIEE